MNRAPVPSIVIDRRKSAAQAHGPRGKWPVVARKVSAVDAVCLHQTACMLGERPGRWDSTGAHLGILLSGAIVWLHDWTKRVAHGNSFNASSVGIEVDGLFAGVAGDLSTVWDNPATPAREQPQSPTDAQIAALHTAIRWICDDLEAMGGKLKRIVAHRQSSPSRRNDPGSEIWQGAALPLIEELGLTDGGPGYTSGGLPIPEAWDPSRAGIKY